MVDIRLKLEWRNVVDEKGVRIDTLYLGPMQVAEVRQLAGIWASAFHNLVMTHRRAKGAPAIAGSNMREVKIEVERAVTQCFKLSAYDFRALVQGNNG